MWIITKTIFIALLTCVLVCTCILSIVDWNNLEYVYARSSFTIVFSGFLGESLILWIIVDLSLLVLNAIYLEVVWVTKRKLEYSLDINDSTTV